MNNKKIEQAEKELLEIEAKPLSEQKELLQSYLKKYRIHGYEKLQDPNAGETPSIREGFKSGHTWLQTQTMINTCITAKWSCFWAAIAAVAALLAVIISLVGTLASWVSVLIMSMKGR
jgi:hypothetical protein